MIRAWQETFGVVPIPDWLRAFDHDPSKAVDDLLWDRVFWGPLQGAAPESLLTDWVIQLGNRSGFQDRLDGTLCRWVEVHWGRRERVRPRQLAETWSRLCDIVRFSGVCEDTERSLLQRFQERNEFLGSLYFGPSCDPQWHYLLAIAEAQHLEHSPSLAASLTSFWWRLCGLAPVVPIHHGPVGLMGLRRRQISDGEELGSFRGEVARGLVKLALGLERRIHPRELSKKQAREVFLAAARLNMAAYPFPERWYETFEEELPSLSGVTRHWIGELLPALPPTPSAQPRGIRASPASWNRKRSKTAGLLAQRSLEAIEVAEKLLGEQRRWAEHHGESESLTRSLCQFSRSTIWSRSDRSVQWAEEAMLWEPWNDFVWSTFIRARSFHEGAWAALPMACEALERFPENAHIRSAAASVLTEMGYLDQAEAVGREIIELFPRHSMGWTGLATTLGKAECFADAEMVLRDGLERFPQDVHLRTRLGVVLRRLGRASEAEQVYRDLLEEKGESEFVLSGLGAALREQGLLDEAESTYERAIDQFPGNPYAWTGLAKVLVQAGDMDRGVEQFRRTTEMFPKFLDAWVPFSDLVCEGPVRHEICPGVRRRTQELKAELQPSLDEVEARLASSWRFQSSEARLLRRWARRVDAKKAAGSAAVLREQAGFLLSRAASKQPDDPSTLTQKGLLLLESGQIEESRKMLALTTSRFVAAPTLLAAFARASREEASSSQRRLEEPGALETLLAPTDRLKGLGSVYEPLVHLQNGRAFLALKDGQQRLEGAARSFDRLNRWIQARVDDPLAIDFEKWWAKQIQANMFFDVQSGVEISQDDVLAVDKQLLDTGFFVDSLEEDFSYRMSWASSS